MDAQQVGQTLNVTAVVTGRVAVRGDRLVIQAELMDVDTGTQLWGDQYNRPRTDLLAVQEEIAEEILDTLQPRISGEERRRVTRRYTDNAEAFQLYLQGRYHWNKGTIDGYKRAIDYFQQAIGKDPKYALAYAGLADSYLLLGSYWVETLPEAKAAAEQALAIDGSLAEAHVALGSIKLCSTGTGRPPSASSSRASRSIRAPRSRTTSTRVPGDRRPPGRRAQPGPPRAGAGPALADRQQRPRLVSALRRTG